MKKILIGTPSIDGKVTMGFMQTLLSLNSIDPGKYQFPIFTVSGNSSIEDARNQIVSIFLTSEFDYLFFLDSDVELRAPDIKTIIEADKDIIGIPVMKKNYMTPTVNVGKELFLPENNIVEVDGISTSAMLIRRNVLEAFKDRPQYNHNSVINKSSFEQPVFYSIFHSGVIDGSFLHEDYMFCRDAREKGFKVYSLRTAVSQHYGTVPFVYNGEQLVSQPSPENDIYRIS